MWKISCGPRLCVAIALLAGEAVEWVWEVVDAAEADGMDGVGLDLW